MTNLDQIAVDELRDAVEGMEPKEAFAWIDTRYEDETLREDALSIYIADCVAEAVWGRPDLDQYPLDEITNARMKSRLMNSIRNGEE